MNSGKVLYTTLLLFLIVGLPGCNNDNILDKKVVETNYIIVLDQLKEKLSPENYSIMEKSINDIVISQYGNNLAKVTIHLEYGRGCSEITYRDVYYCDIEIPKKNYSTTK